MLKTDSSHRIASALLAALSGLFLIAGSVVAEANADFSNSSLSYAVEDLPVGTFFYGAYDNKGRKFGYKKVEYDFFTSDDGKSVFSERSIFVMDFINSDRETRYSSVYRMEHFFSVDDGLELSAALHNYKIKNISFKNGGLPTPVNPGRCSGEKAMRLKSFARPTAKIASGRYRHPA